MRTPCSVLFFKYHVVEPKLFADLSDGQMIETLLGEDATVSITADGVFINQAQVIVADIAADNGVVHVIDVVLVPVPEETTVVDIIVVESEDHTLLDAAAVAAGYRRAERGRSIHGLRSNRRSSRCRMK